MESSGLNPTQNLIYTPFWYESVHFRAIHIRDHVTLLGSDMTITTNVIAITDCVIEDKSAGESGINIHNIGTDPVFVIGPYTGII